MNVILAKLVPQQIKKDSFEMDTLPREKETCQVPYHYDSLRSKTKYYTILSPFIQALVDGFVREQQNEYKDLNIPKEINYICNKYLFEIWDTFCSEKSSKHVQISEDGLTYIQGADRHQCVFGKELIESMDNDSVYSWTLKIIDRGISCDYEYDRNGYGDRFDYSDIGSAYYYNAFSGTIRSRAKSGSKYITKQQTGHKLVKNDTLIITLDMNKGQLTFEAIKDNETKSKTVTIGNIIKEKDLKYRLVVLSAMPGDSMQIVSFSKVQSK